MKIKPIYDRVLLKPLDKPQVEGIALPDTASKEMPVKGEVVAVGKDCKYVRVKDKVFFGKFSADEIKESEEKLLFIREDNIFGIIS